MTIRHLQIFQTVCSCNSITAAARRLNITQPSVSIAIKELEAFYHTKLFDRINRRIYLTEEGMSLLQYTDTLLSQYEESISVLRSGMLFTKCRIGANVSAAETFLSRIISAVHTELPQIRFSICIQNNEQIDQLLADNQIDFAVYDQIGDRETRTARLLFRDELVVCCPPDWEGCDSISLEQLSKMPLLLREKGSGMRNFIDVEFSKHGYPQNIAAESISTLGLVELAEAGLGYALVPRELVKKLNTNFQIKVLTICDCALEKSYYLSYNKKKYLNPALMKVIQVLDHAAWNKIG